MWINSFTKREELEPNKYGMTIYSINQVFKDKEDNAWKAHKLTDDRPYSILMQSANCCVEVYPYYSVYYDVDHEEVMVEDTRWVVEEYSRGRWRDLGFWNPILTIENIPNGIKVVREGETTDGLLRVELILMDASCLKHKVTWTNTSTNNKTVRVVWKWSGIAGNKISCSKTVYTPPITINDFNFIFGDEENPNKVGLLLEMEFDSGLLNPVSIETHANGMKADFEFEEFILAQNESLILDPSTWSNSDPTEDGYIQYAPPTYTRYTTRTYMRFGHWTSGKTAYYGRAYAEWNIDGIPDNATISLVKFQYHGLSNTLSTDWSYIYEISNQPSVSSDSTVYNDCKSGTVYVNQSTTFPVVGTNQEIDLGSSAVSNLESILASRSWWAIGMVTEEGTQNEMGEINTEEKSGVTPAPTLYVEYTVPEVVGNLMMGCHF